MDKDIYRSIFGHFMRISRAMHHHGSRFGHRLPLREMGETTVLQLQAMFFIKQNRQTTLGDLATEFGITPASASLLVDRMVEAGLVIRSTDEADRRKVFLTLAKHTDIHMRRGFLQKTRTLKELFSTLSEEELTQLDAILSKLEKSAQNKFKSQQPEC